VLAPGQGASAQSTLVVDSLGALGTLVDAANCGELNAAPEAAEPSTDSAGLPFRKCDDGLPSGTDGGAKGIPVPAAYHSTGGNDYTGLPAPASADEVATADAAYDVQPDASGDRITLDVDISLPPAGTPPKKGYPVIVFMHGCCGGSKASWEADDVDAAGEKWHHSNAYFASRGYVVVNYTARGFRNGNQEGSSGTTQLDSRRFEVNDYQYLVGLLVDDDAVKKEAGEAPVFNVNPKKVAAVGGSYGGGFTWLALTDPTWKSPMKNIPIKLAAAVPKYGWTDLLEALVPSGHYQDRDPKTGKTVVAATDVAKAPSRNPVGVEKQSIVAGLYATGNDAHGNHTTFAQNLHTTYARLQAGEPYDSDASVQEAADEFLNDRSAYYQTDFWNRVSHGLHVPVFSAATWTDPLFPTMEHMRFYNKLKSVDKDYPIVQYLGDYQHFVQNKAKEWDDLCGDDHHICTFEDYLKPNGTFNLNKAPTRKRSGIDSRISKFLDFYLKGIGKRPKNDVTSTTTICPSNASTKYPADEPGIEYRAPTWRKLAPKVQAFGWEGGGVADTTTSSMSADGHATGDPVAQNGHEECYAPDQANPGPGVVQYVSEPIPKSFTLMGIPWVDLKFDATGADYWVTVRVYDQTPDDTMQFVTRGICKVSDAAEAGCDSFDLWGNAWTFTKGDRVVLEVSQGDSPTFRKDNMPSSLTFSSADLTLPVVSKSRRHDFRD
jgi:predicted acyl esterase